MLYNNDFSDMSKMTIENAKEYFFHYQCSSFMIKYSGIESFFTSLNLKEETYLAWKKEYFFICLNEAKCKMTNDESFIREYQYKLYDNLLDEEALIALCDLLFDYSKNYEVDKEALADLLLGSSYNATDGVVEAAYKLGYLNIAKKLYSLMPLDIIEKDKDINRKNILIIKRYPDLF